MAKGLTEKQEAFVLDVFQQETLAQSYRNHYDTANMADKTIWEASSRLMADSKVTARLSELQQEAAGKAQVTVASLTVELEEARKVSKKEGQGAAMTSASMGKAKLHGLLIDKSEMDLKGKLDTKWTVEIVKPKKHGKK